jgi:hypothetical protein
MGAPLLRMPDRTGAPTCRRDGARTVAESADEQLADGRCGVAEVSSVVGDVRALTLDPSIRQSVEGGTLIDDDVRTLVLMTTLVWWAGLPDRNSIAPRARSYRPLDSCIRQRSAGELTMERGSR